MSESRTWKGLFSWRWLGAGTPRKKPICWSWQRTASTPARISTGEYMCGAAMMALSRFGVPPNSYRLTTEEVLQRVLRARPANSSTETCASLDEMRTAIGLIWDTDLYDAKLRHARYEYGNFAAGGMVEATYVPILRTFTTLANWEGINKHLPSDEVGEDLIRAASAAYVVMWRQEASP